MDEMQELGNSLRAWAVAGGSLHRNGPLVALKRRIDESLLRAAEVFMPLIDPRYDSVTTRNIVLKAVGDACNLRCTYCPTRNFDVSKFPDRESLFEIIRNALDTPESHVDVTVHGGEPLLLGKERMHELLNFIAETRALYGKKGVTRVQTNGVLVDEEWVNLFQKTHASVGISIDVCRETHDRHRVDKGGCGTFDAAARGYKLLTESGLASGVICVLPDDTEEWPLVRQAIQDNKFKNLEIEILGHLE